MPAAEIPVMPIGTLPPLLVNQSNKGEYKVLTYKNVWDAQKKRSFRSCSRTVGVIKDGSKDGIVRFNKDFTDANPWIDDFVVEHKGRQWILTRKAEHEQSDLEDVLPEEQMEFGGVKFSELSEREQVKLLNLISGNALHAGAAYALGVLAKQSGISKALKLVFPQNDDYLKLLSLAMFVVINSDSALSCYPEFAEKALLPYEQELDCSAISRLLGKITSTQIEDFLNIMCGFWMQEHHAEEQPILLALDSTPASAYSANPAMDGCGKNKDGGAQEQINILLLTDHKTGLPVYYRAYDGAVPDVSTVSADIRPALDLGLKPKVVLVSDQDCIFSDNITEAVINDLGFLFNCTVNANGSWVQGEIDKVYEELMHTDSFNGLMQQHALTTTIEWKYSPLSPLPVKDSNHRDNAAKELYLHICFDPDLHNKARKDLSLQVFKLKTALQQGTSLEQLSASEQAVARALLVQKKDKSAWEVDESAFNQAVRYKGIRALVSDTISTALEAHKQYTARQAAESAFLTLKQRLSCDRLQTLSGGDVNGMCFLQFIAAALSLMVQMRLDQWEDAAAADKSKPQIYCSASTVLRSLNNCMARRYKGKGIIFQEIVGRTRLCLRALGVPQPEHERFVRSCQDAIDMVDAEDAAAG